MHPNDPALQRLIDRVMSAQAAGAALCIRGGGTKDFYGIRREPNGLYKNRTGAIYKIPSGRPHLALGQERAGDAEL